MYCSAVLYVARARACCRRSFARLDQRGGSAGAAGVCKLQGTRSESWGGGGERGVASAGMRTQPRYGRTRRAYSCITASASMWGTLVLVQMNCSNRARAPVRKRVHQRGGRAHEGEQPLCGFQKNLPHPEGTVAREPGSSGAQWAPPQPPSPGMQGGPGAQFSCNTTCTQVEGNTRGPIAALEANHSGARRR